MGLGVVDSFFIILCIALVVTVIFRYLKLPIILGYVLVGAVVGPHVLDWLPDIQTIRELAEFGVVLLMFAVGLEFSLPKLFSLRQAVFVLGGLQVTLTICISAAIGMMLHIPFLSSIVLGSIIAMSSTAIVIKQLSDQGEIKTPHGTNAVGILLFQDLAVIPVLIVIASVGGHSGDHTVLFNLSWAFGKGLLAVLLILVLGRWVIKPFFHLIAATRTIELFTLSVLFVAVGSAFLTNTLGLSYALGAFLAGIMLAECEYQQQIKAEIRPFRDILLGLFFISIGMLVDISTWLARWPWITLMVVGLLFGKTLLIILLNRLAKYDAITSIRTGLILAQGGEFGFAILTVALLNKVIPTSWSQSILAALLISFICAPILIRFNEKIALSLTLRKQNVA